MDKLIDREPILSLHDIEIRQGGFTLRVPRLNFLPGRLYALGGPNGAGKSTLLRLLALLEAPHRGELYYNGAPIQGEAGRRVMRREITLVHQSPYLFDGTVRQNLAFGLRLRGVHGAEQERRIAGALDAVGLEGFAGRRVRELSGGEAQRVALARALALRPRVLLLDEPTAGFDREQLPAFEHWLAALPKQGVTVILTTHDHDQPRRLGAHLLRLKDGRLQMPPTVLGGSQTAIPEPISWPLREPA